MKNLMQKLVRTTLCVGVVCLTLVACSSDTAEDANVITLDQLDDMLIDTMDVEGDTLSDDDVIIENVDANVEKESE